MAIAFGQHLFEMDRNGTGSASTVLSGSKTVAAGDLLVAAMVAYDGTGASPTATDNLGNTWALGKRSDGTYDSAMLYAYVTNPGTLTTITITTDSTRYVAAEAASFTGASGPPVDAAGVATDTGASVEWCTSKDIPAGGLVVGFVGGNVSDTYSAGAASGTPSTTPILIDAHASANMSAGLFYALGGSGVTGFTGNAATGGAGTFSCVGLIFSSAVGIPAATSGFRSIRSLRSLRSLGR